MGRATARIRDSRGVAFLSGPSMVGYDPRVVKEFECRLVGEGGVRNWTTLAMLVVALGPAADALAGGRTGPTTSATSSRSWPGGATRATGP